MEGYHGKPVVTEQPAYPQPGHHHSAYPEQPHPAHPHQPHPAQHTGNTTVVVTQQSPQYVSTTGYLLFSCAVFWCCNWPLGLIAFICAMMAQSAANSGDTEGALRCGRISCGLSIAGIVVTVIVMIVVVVVVTTGTSYSYSYSTSG